MFRKWPRGPSWTGSAVSSSNRWTTKSARRKGTRFLLLGDTFYFLAKNKGRRPSTREQAAARGAYNIATARHARRKVVVDDDQLAEQAAIQLARVEQQHRPTNLIEPPIAT